MTGAEKPSALTFTGERFTPENVREMWFEHWHRYLFASHLAAGRRVLDCACGEGYGAAMLARNASSVVAVDVDGQTLAHAARRYGDQGNLEFFEADATHLDRLGNREFDLITSFETLEHLEDHDALLGSLVARLATDGVLLISTPDRAVYSDARDYRNPFHVRELYRAEFEALLGRHFGAVQLLGQRLLFASTLTPIASETAHSGDPETTAPEAVPATLEWLDSQGHLQAPGEAPMYYIAVCARSAQHLPTIPPLHAMTDVEQSVYAHYCNEIRRVMAGGARILELEAQVERLQSSLSEATLSPSNEKVSEG